MKQKRDVMKIVSQQKKSWFCLWKIMLHLSRPSSPTLSAVLNHDYKIKMMSDHSLGYVSQRNFAINIKVFIWIEHLMKKQKGKNKNKKHVFQNFLNYIVSHIRLTVKGPTLKVQ